ncbi:hypothetical protein HW555_004586 [Spodoptera exigua]|uniref:Peptidase S1 domain-containing protein n=1 Tax=Spodoptera exigua TaxID=7107 RepID=A0A835GLN6_SPOEX|nr:hypothetical protein HW555_004586 [Spodoptera exigua]
MLIIQEYTTTTETTTTTKAIKTNEKANLRVGSGLYVDPTTYRVRVGSSHVDDSVAIIVRFGQTFRPTGLMDVLSTGGRRHEVSAIIVHEGYRLFENSIALVRTWKAVRLGLTVAPIQIPFKFPELSENTTVTLVGWNSRGRRDLREIFIPMVSWAKCRKIYSRFITFTTNMFCAGALGSGDKRDEDEEVCTYGNPLLYGKYLVGILIYAKGCANQVTPAVYTRISEYTNWIDVTMTMDSHRGDQLIGATSSINIVGVTLLIPLLFLLLSV